MDPRAHFFYLGRVLSRHRERLLPKFRALRETISNLPVVAEGSGCSHTNGCCGRQSFLQRDGAAVARQAHNLEVAGSNPAPATESEAA